MMQPPPGGTMQPPAGGTMQPPAGGMMQAPKGPLPVLTSCNINGMQGIMNVKDPKPLSPNHQPFNSLTWPQIGNNNHCGIQAV
jgi:hypothetical protein